MNETLEENIVSDFRRITTNEFKLKILNQLASSIGLKVTKSNLSLPSAAPCLWKSDHTYDDPQSFISVVYKEWIGNGLTQAHIRNLDSSLYNALHNWLRTNTLSIDLPTKKQFNDRQIGAFQAAATGSLRKNIMSPEARAAQNLYATALRRRP